MRASARSEWGLVDVDPRSQLATRRSPSAPRSSPAKTARPTAPGIVLAPLDATDRPRQLQYATSRVCDRPRRRRAIASAGRCVGRRRVADAIAAAGRRLLAAARCRASSTTRCCSCASTRPRSAPGCCTRHGRRGLVACRRRAARRAPTLVRARGRALRAPLSVSTSPRAASSRSLEPGSVLRRRACSSSCSAPIACYTLDGARGFEPAGRERRSRR